MSFEQQVQTGTQGGIVPASVVEKGGALGGGGFLQRRFEQSFFVILLYFVHGKGPLKAASTP